MSFEGRSNFRSQLITKTAERRRDASRRTALESATTAPVRNDLLPRLSIECVPTARLRPAGRRVRKSESDQLLRVMQSIRAFGIVLPVLVDPDLRIVDGHIMVEAARKLDLPEVPCVRISHLDDKQLRLLRLGLNRIAEKGVWDIDELRIELVELGELGCNLDVTGFSPQEIDIILLDERHGGIDECPSLPLAPVSRPGDLWSLGDHRLYCGNALEADSYALLLAGRKVQATFADPPYNCRIEGNVSGLGKTKHTDFVMAAGEMSDTEFAAFLKTWLVHAANHSVAGAAIFACMDWRQIGTLLGAGKEAGLVLANLAVWNKGSGGMGSLYRSAHELVPVFSVGSTLARNNVMLGKHGRDRTNVWTFPGANRPGTSCAEALAEHPTPKPVELVVEALLDVTKRGDAVLDPFMGSGTTLLAAERSGRTAFGMELDPRYADLCVQRWQAMTGRKAAHADLCLPFDKVAAVRMAEGAAS